jgi:hypothetical protein
MKAELQNLINEYRLIEELCADTSKKAHRARVALERSVTEAPAPKRGVSKKKKEEFLNKFRKRIMRRSLAAQ